MSLWGGTTIPPQLLLLKQRETVINKPKTWTAKDVKELLHFGPDFLRINLKQKEGEKSRSISFLDAIFSMPHNTSNSNTFDDFVWADTSEEVRIIFTDGKMGEVAQIYKQGEFIFRVVLVDRVWAKNLHYEYKYRLDCYGIFFALERQKLLSVETFLDIFIKDDRERKIDSSVSREDICSDFSGYTTNSVFRGIRGSKKHRKKSSNLATDPITGLHETIYYGDPKEADRWFLRIYNKLLDIKYKKKEKFYFEYFDHAIVTRLEEEIRSDSCKDYGITLQNCLNREYLWGVYIKLLDNQFVKWKIVAFLERELKKKFFAKSLIERREHMPIPLEQTDYGRRIVSQLLSFEDRYNANAVDFIISHFSCLKQGEATGRVHNNEATEFIRQNLSLLKKSFTQNEQEQAETVAFFLANLPLMRKGLNQNDLPIEQKSDYNTFLNYFKHELLRLLSEIIRRQESANTVD